MTKASKKMILIVEDDEILLRALYLLFHGGDYTIASATDGDTALKMTLRLKPDLVLLAQRKNINNPVNRLTGTIGVE